MADENDKPINGNGTNDAIDTPPADTSFRPSNDIVDEDVRFEETQKAGATAASAKTDAGAASAPASAAQTLKENAAMLTKNVGEHAKSYVEDGKARAGSALDDLARMMHDAAGTVDEKVGAQYGQYARSAAETVTGFSESLKAKNIDDLVADASSFVKKSPGIAIGAAAAIGFVLIRLAQSGINARPDDQS